MCTPSPFAFCSFISSCQFDRLSARSTPLLQFFQHYLRRDRIICRHNHSLCLDVSLDIRYAVYFAQNPFDRRGTSLTFVQYIWWYIYICSVGRAPGKTRNENHNVSRGRSDVVRCGVRVKNEEDGRVSSLPQKGERERRSQRQATSGLLVNKQTRVPSHSNVEGRLRHDAIAGRATRMAMIKYAGKC